MSEDRRRSVDLGRSRSTSSDLPRPTAISGRSPTPRFALNSDQIRYPWRPSAGNRRTLAGASPVPSELARSTRDAYVGVLRRIRLPLPSYRVGCRCSSLRRTEPKRRIWPHLPASPVRASGTADDKKRRPHLSRGFYERARVPHVRRNRPPGVPPTISHA